MCSCLFIEMNQTAHISLQILAISKSVETKSNWMRRNFLGAPRPTLPLFFPSGPSKHPLRRSVWRSVVRLSAAGEGVFTDGAGCPQALFAGDRHLFFKNLEP